MMVPKLTVPIVLNSPILDLGSIESFIGVFFFNLTNYHKCFVNMAHADETSHNESFYGTGPGCSKLITSLVNVSLKFQSLISEI